MIKEFILQATRRSAPVKIDATQGSNELVCVFRFSDYEIPSGATANIYIKKPSGAKVFNSCAVDTTAQTITFTPTVQCFAEPGPNKAQLQLKQGSRILNSFIIDLAVQETIIDDSAIESRDEFTALQTALAAAQNFVTVDTTQTVTGAKTFARQITAAGYKTTPDLQTGLRWTTSDSAANKHDAAICGGGGSSTYGALLYDYANGRRVWAYNDQPNDDGDTVLLLGTGNVQVTAQPPAGGANNTQVATTAWVNNAIATKNVWQCITANFATTGTAWSCVEGAEITVPEGKNYEVYATVSYSAGRPIGILLALEAEALTNGSKVWGLTETAVGYVCNTGIVRLAAGTYHLWTRRAGNGNASNKHIIYYREG